MGKNEKVEGEMALRRLNLSLKSEYALEVTRVAIGSERLVYALLANKQIQYKWGKSAIAYIGTTETGASRIASSAAERAEDLLRDHGIKKITARVITCKPRKNVRTWEKLERAFLLEFRSRYGEVPRANTQGKNIREKDEFSYFAKSRLAEVLLALSDPPSN